MNNIEKVRLLCTDKDKDIFSDAEIESFLIMNDGDERLAAAEALQTMAVSEALIMKKVSVLDISTDGAAIANSLMNRAKRLREAVESDSDFGIANMY